MAVNQQQLATKFNVSQVTISRALRGQKGVSDKLRDRILREAKRQGYSLEASFAARAMRDKGIGRESSTNVICAILPGDLDDHSFTGRLLRGISQEGPKQGSEVVFVTHVMNSLPLVVHRRQVDGVINMLGDIPVQEGRTDCPLPWISIFFDVAAADLVTVDQVNGGRQLGEHLGQLGHQTVAFIGPDMELADQRLRGARDGLQAHGGDIPDALVLTKQYGANPDDTVAFVDQILAKRRETDVTAICAYNDFMASFAINRLREKGVLVPEEISVTGFDGAISSALHAPQITTAAIPLEELGSEAVRLLCWRLANPDAKRRQVILETELQAGITSSARSLPFLAPSRWRCAAISTCGRGRPRLPESEPD